MDWVTVGSVIGSLGGFEFIKWLVNRKAHMRRENATARDAEVTLHEKQIERYEQRLAQRDGKVDAIYRDLREAQMREIELVKENNRLKLEIELLTYQKCEVRGCAQRKPPGLY